VPLRIQENYFAIAIIVLSLWWCRQGIS
jgi:hypothetical protein